MNSPQAWFAVCHSGWLESQVKVFVPFYEDAMDDAMGDAALHGAVLVPFERGYNLLHIERARASDPYPEPGHAQILPPEDWPTPVPRQATQH